MKYLIHLFLIMTINSWAIFSQEFSFQMKFEDAIGNRDSIILGFDPEATDSIDSQFGEINIANKVLDTAFDVRISNEWHVRAIDNYTSKQVHLKKQVLKKNCNSWDTYIGIDIKCNNWPVTASWDKSLFKDSCIAASMFSSINPNNCCDVLTTSNLWRNIMMENDTVTFSSNTRLFTDQSIGSTSYINEHQDTVSVFWFAFDKKFLVNINKSFKTNPIYIFPNPGNGKYQINKQIKHQIQSIYVYDLRGRLIFHEVNPEFINISEYNKGTYFYRILLDNDTFLNGILLYQ